MYIHERDNWTDFRWDMSQVSLLQEKVFRMQGLLYGRLSSVGFDSKLRAMAENLTYDVVYSSEIEGIRLNVDQVRSSIARKLGIENVKYTAPSHYVDSVVGVMLEAVQHYDMTLSKEKLCAWQAAFFPTGYSEGSQIDIGQYRTNEEHIVSGMFGREKIHYIAPSPDRVEEEQLDCFHHIVAKETVKAAFYLQPFVAGAFGEGVEQILAHHATPIAHHVIDQREEQIGEAVEPPQGQPREKAYQEHG